MKLDRLEKALLALLIGFLLFLLAGVAHETLRHDPGAVAQTWKDVMFWLMLLGAVIFFTSAFFVYSTPTSTHK